MLYPQAVFTAAASPNRNMGTLPTSAPTVAGDAHGRVPAHGLVSIGVSGACTVELFIYSSSMGWKHPSSGSGGYSKTFSESAFDYLAAHPGELFYIKSDTGSITGHTDGERLTGVSHA